MAADFLWVAVVSVLVLFLVTLCALHARQLGFVQSVAPRDVDETPVMAATVLANRVNDDDLNTLTSSNTETHLYRAAAAEEEQPQDQLDTREHSRVESTYPNYRNPYTVDNLATHSPPTSGEERNSQRSRSDALPAVHPTSPHSHRHHNDSSQSSRSTSTRTTETERSPGARYSSYSGQYNRPHDTIESDIDDSLFPTPLPVDGASIFPSHDRRRGRRRSYPVARDVLPLGVNNTNPLAPMRLLRNSISDVVRLSPAAPLHNAHGESRLSPRAWRGPAGGTRSSGRIRLWQRLRRNGGDSEPPSHNNESAGTVVNGYCCDEHGRRLQDEENCYGSAQYTSRGPGTAAVVETPLKEVKQEDGASLSVFSDAKPRTPDHDCE
ncbi:hypothetical protein IOCL2690_000652700 [Leishmania lindenbergi]|uniref:Uncharacterized protein n=1 Tax=Leishmania lindenbergi TaxID=651832 RepID=A0AAW3A3P3_9TRYP